VPKETKETKETKEKKEKKEEQPTSHAGPTILAHLHRSTALHHSSRSHSSKQVLAH
jgi:hypothetical protein